MHVRSSGWSAIPIDRVSALSSAPGELVNMLRSQPLPSALLGACLALTAATYVIWR
jgi:hypothetical protein